MYKIYAESFKGPRHLDEIVTEAKRIVGGGAGGGVVDTVGRRGGAGLGGAG